MIIGYILFALIVVALIVAIYSGTGGRAWFGTREVPAEFVGQTVQLRDCELSGSTFSELPPARVTSFDAPDYRLDFTTPFLFDGREEHFVRIRFRHAGYPVSSAAKLSVRVGATLESGRSFIARVVLC